MMLIARDEMILAVIQGNLISAAVVFIIVVLVSMGLEAWDGFKRYWRR